MNAKELFFLALCSLFINALSAQSTVDQLIGTNAEAKDPIERVTRFSLIRDYHDWSKDTGYDTPFGSISCPPNLKLKWNPSADGADYYSFDAFYRAVSGRSSAALKGTSPELVGLNSFPNCNQFLELKPLCVDGQTAPGFDFNNCKIQGQDYLNDINNSTAVINAMDPRLYIGHAKWMTMYAARYGRTVYDPASEFITGFFELNLEDNENSNTGLGYATFVENNNEPDKTWYDDEMAVKAQNDHPELAITFWYMAPEQYAALVSADYDGHGKSEAFRIDLPNEERYYGVKNTDPEMSFVLAGLAEMRGEYIERMVQWFVDNRQSGVYGFVDGPVIPFDVINMHHYSTQLTQAPQTQEDFLEMIYNDLNRTVLGTGGISPEDDLLRQKIGWFLNILSENNHWNLISDKEIWLTEFGYDSENSELSGVDVPAIIRAIFLKKNPEFPSDLVGRKFGMTPVYIYSLHIHRRTC